MNKILKNVILSICLLSMLFLFSDVIKTCKREKSGQYLEKKWYEIENANRIDYGT